MSVTIESTVGEWVVERPSLARVFEKLGIDYCCGGKQPLAKACQAKGLDPATVSALLEAGDGISADAGLDVSSLTMTEIADHIEATHHAYLKQELPRLQPLIEKIASKHSDKNPKLTRLPAVFNAFRQELESHMAKEENILFPIVREMETNPGKSDFHCGSVANPIRVMEAEHQHAGDALEQMRLITDGYHAPANACNTYRAVMHSLAQLEHDMHHHVHKENNVLFPRAIKAEANA